MKHNRKFTEEMLRVVVKFSKSFANVLRELNIRQAGGSQSHIKRMCIKHNIDFSHFTGQAHNKGKISNRRKTPQEILVFDEFLEHRSKHLHLRRALIESGIKYECECCQNNGVWLGKPITLNVDHKDGDYRNNVQGNLRFLCPNCHSQTQTFGAKNKPVYANRQSGLIQNQLFGDSISPTGTS